MNTQLNPRFTLFAWIFCAISLSQFAVSQTGGVELVFTNPLPITLQAGEQVCFQLVAKDAGGATITDWNSSGINVTLVVTNTIVDTDTILDTWSRHADGFTWSKLVVAGQTMTASSPHEFPIAKSLFTNGVADACYQATCAEQDVRITVTPPFASLNQISPPITYTPAALDNFLVELSIQIWPIWDSYNLYAKRPFEFIVVARDRFLNRIAGNTPVRIEVEYPAELDSVPGTIPNPFDPALTINTSQNFFLRPNTERESAVAAGHRITAYLPSDASIRGVCDRFFAVPHPPVPFALQSPADQIRLLLLDGGDWEMFSWEKPIPADPYTDIQISRFSGTLSTDDIHYRIHFTDAAASKDLVFDSDSTGFHPFFSIMASDLITIVDTLSGSHKDSTFEVIWYVEATDGDYTTASTPISPTIPGRRFTVKNETFTGKGVGASFAPQNPTVMRASGEVNFELQALDNGNLVADWNDTGSDVTLMVKNCTANSDTSTRSWNADPNAYSWAKLTVNGEDIPPSAPDQYTIAKTHFTNGRAVASYRSSKAESDIRIEVEPTVPGLGQSSPPLSWEADTLGNFLVEITWPDSTTPGVYVQRPFELVITPRDPFLNAIQTDTPVRIIARFPNELDTIPGSLPNPFDPNLMVRGAKGIMLLSTTERDTGQAQLQSFEVRQPHAPGIAGISESFSVLPHAPNRFALLSPIDMTEIRLMRLVDIEVFTWERPDPPDPYTNIRLSRFSGNRMSDDIRYHLYFLDQASLTRAMQFTADDEGRLPQFTATHGQLANVIDQISGMPTTKRQDVVWYVEASDGLYTTRSDFPSTLPGNRLKLTKDSGGNVVCGPFPTELELEQNYPNPFNPSTTIRFTTLRRGIVSLKVYDLLGSEVATVHNGALDAGTHSVTFDASKLRSGVYMYRLQAEGQMLSRRMVLMK